MTLRQKHVLAVHDISCMGRCSLTIALPVISAAGITTTVMPTAVLSTHTGGLSGYTYRDLTSDMLAIADHWQTLSPSFDAIYTGYLGSKEQLEIVAELIRRFKALAVIDPVMGDHGRLYAGFAPDFPLGMKKLCSHADVICPNMTEALMMLDMPYQEGPYSREFMEEILVKLAKIAGKVVLTGVYFSEDEYGAAAYEGSSIHYALKERIPGTCHGTGDLFASVLTAGLVSGSSLNKATDAAAEFTAGSIRRTYEAGTDTRFGVNFEAGLKDLAGLINE